VLAGAANDYFFHDIFLFKFNYTILPGADSSPEKRWLNNKWSFISWVLNGKTGVLRESGS